MANNRVVVNFDFKANMGDVQSNLNALKNNLLQIQTIGSNTSSFLGINQGLKQASIAAQQLQTHLAGATNPFTKQLDLSMFSKSLQSAGLNVTQLSNSLLGAGATGQQAFKNLALTIASAQAPALQLSATMGKLMTTFANNARWMVSSSVLTGFVSSIREAVDYTKDLNESLTDIRIVTGKSKEEMDSVARSANRMAKELKTSTAEIVKGQLIYYQQGDSAELAAKKAEITTKAANVSFGTSQEQMSEYLTAIWNSYQVGEDQLEEFVDVLAAVGATTATSMEEIATAMQKVAATGNAVGVSYEQLTATIATISSVTRTSSEQVGTALKTIYARIGDLKAGGLDEDDIGLGQVSSGLKKVGVEILDTNNNIRDMGEVVEEIGGKWNTWTEAQQQAIVQLIAGKRQYTQMMALFENWGMYESTLATAEGADGELNKQQEIWAESWEAASQNVQASLESIYTKIFDDDVFIDLLNTLNGVIVVFDTLTDAFGGIGPILMQISALILHHFKVPIIDALANVKYGFDILTGNAQRAHEQMRNQFFQGIDFSQMDAGLKMEIQSLGQLTEIQDQYKLNMSQIHKAQRLQIENSIEIAQALRNQALAQQEVADKQKQSIANTITASKASSSTKNAARENLERVSADAVQAEMARQRIRNAQEVNGKYNPAAAGAIIANKSEAQDRTQFLKNNQESFNSVLEKTKQYYQEILNNQTKFEGIVEKIKNKEIEITQQLERKKQLTNDIERMENADSSDQRKYDEQYGTGAFEKNLAKKKAELQNLDKSLNANKGSLTKWKQELENSGVSAENLEKEMEETKNKLTQTEKAMKTLRQATSGTDISAEDFSATIKILNQSLNQGTLSQDQFAEQFREIGVTLGLTDDQLDAFVKEILEMISSTAAANMSQEEFQRKLKETANRIKAAGDSTDKMNKKINGDSLMNAASAMMSMSSAASSVSSMFKTFGDENASAVDKVTSATGALTQSIFAVTMAMKMLGNLNPWLKAITIVLSVLPLLVEGIDAVWVTQEEKVEKLKKETEELTEKYNEQKAVIDELQAKKEAGVDNQAQLDALDEEIKREKRKLKYIEQQNEEKKKQYDKERSSEIRDRFSHGEYSKGSLWNDMDSAESAVSSYVSETSSQYHVSTGNEAAIKALVNQEDMYFDKAIQELTENPEKYGGADYVDDWIAVLEDARNASETTFLDMLEDVETYTSNGRKLTSDMINSLAEGIDNLYGGNMTSEAIAQLGSYISGIDEMSDTELQSLLEKLFPEEDKDKLVERFKKGLQEVDGEMDQFGKKQTLAKSLENAGKAIDKVQSALKEIGDTGFLSYSTIEEMGTALDKAGVASAEWKQALYDANGNAEKTKEVLGQIANEIANATIEAQNFSQNLHFNGDGSLTNESQEYISNVEKMIAAQLRSNGVLNAEEEARDRVTAAIIKEMAKKGSSIEQIQDYLTKNGYAVTSTNNLTAALTLLKAQEGKTTFTNLITSLETLRKSLANSAKAGLIDIAVIKRLQALADQTDLVNDDGTVKENLYYNSKTGKIISSSELYKMGKEGKIHVPQSSAEYGKEITKEKAIEYYRQYYGLKHYSKGENLLADFDFESIYNEVLDESAGIDIDDLDISVTDPGDKGGSGGVPYWKQMYETNVARAEFLQKRDGLTDEWLGQQMDYWYNEYVKGHELELKDPKTGETWEEYSFDEQKKATEKKKSGVKKVFEDAIKDIERNSDSINMGRVSTLLSDTLNKQTELGFTFSPEEKAELIDDYVSLVDGLMKEASSDLDTKFENQEFFSGIINLDEKMAGYNDLLKTAQDYLDKLRANEATEEQLAEYENSVVIPLIKKKRDLLKEEADAAKKATEHYIKMSEFYGYKNGDNEIKARERSYKRMLNLTQEQILAEYGTYKEYWYALEEERLEIDQIFRDKLKEALEKEKDDRIAILEAEKNAAEKLYEGENTLREKRKQINDQLQESLTMYQYLDKATRKLIFNEEDYLALSNTLNEIEEDMYDLNQKYLRDIVGKEADELEYINAEYERQNELLMNRYEIAEKELGIIKARTELENTLKERNTQMFINGRWQWVADQKAVIEAQKKLNDAEFDLETSELENEQELLINSFEKQIDNANKAWEKATKVLEDKVMTVAELMGSLSEPMDDLTAKFYELATGREVTSRGEIEKQKSIEDAESELAKDTALAIIRKKEEYDAAKAQGDMTKAQEIEEQAKASYQILQDLGYNELAEELHKSDLATAKQLNLNELAAKARQTEIIAEVTSDAANQITEATNKVASEVSKIKINDSSKSQEASGALGGGASGMSAGDYMVQIQGMPAWLNGKSGYAKGTQFAIKGMAQINEIGEETFVTPDGHFRNFAGGEVVFTHEQSQRLFSLLNADLFDINKMPKVGEFEQSNSNDTYISIGGISVNTATQDGKDLVEILQRITNL